MGTQPGNIPASTAEADQQKTRLQVFANVFKSYMGVMPMVTAALAPLLTALNVLPMYASERNALATMAGVLGFLLLAWLFYVRRTIALGSIRRYYRSVFNFIPLLLIAGSLGCYVEYSHTLDASVGQILRDNPTLKRSDALGAWTTEHPAPQMVELQLLYLGMFLMAEAAFVMMALREYANDVRGVSEYEWIFGVQDGSDPRLPKAIAAVAAVKAD
ncbi:MAG TPA: hypothetical protein VHX60_16330 [Acidobacteriaceae bacterium]|jgi:hypothetical protein|nr:hypothetical protein [Acidobacteriaceae bacterium]